MPWLARLDAPGVLHHVIGRDIAGTKIFPKNRDESDFIARLAQLAQHDARAIYAWAPLPNHFHLLCKTKKLSLASNTREFLTSYVVSFNNPQQEHGHLFQNRHKSIVCQGGTYLTELARYVHLNSLQVGLREDLAEFSKSSLSGHLAQMGHVRGHGRIRETEKKANNVDMSQ